MGVCEAGNRRVVQGETVGLTSGTLWVDPAVARLGWGPQEEGVMGRGESWASGRPQPRSLERHEERGPVAPSSVKYQACVMLVFAGDMRVSLLVGQEIRGDGEIVCAQ